MIVLVPVIVTVVTEVGKRSSHRGGQEEKRGCRRERETERKRRHQKIYASQVKASKNVKNIKLWTKNLI